ncbi:MAG: DegV family EDD domain-containing protein [Butyrivibrio sp.]|nr:DegV family EDD domain-containing protein [Butyrivibrio sp.]
MIAKLFKSVAKGLTDPGRSQRERTFFLLTMVTEFMAVIALIGDLIFGENRIEIITLIGTMIIVPVITVLCVRKNRVNLAVRLIVLGFVFVTLPTVFFTSGGIRGGAVMWIIFAYLYSGLVLTGKWRPIMLMILTAESVILYSIDYYHPELITDHNNELFHIDSLLSMVQVGIVCCLMVWFVERLFRDENKRAREEARKYEELNMSQNRFFSSMSHEIRTPINSILGLNEIILRQEDASEEIRKDAGNIQGAGRMLLALVNDILDVSKIEAGKMDIIPVNYEVESMFSEIVNMIWLRAEQKGLELKVQIDPSIPRELFGDEVRIKQILVNLLNNAVKYTKEGTVTLQVEKDDIKDDSILLTMIVSDTGMGIRQEAIPYLFDAFQRADEEKNRKIEGTGLGLSIVKQLLDLMGGSISVSSVYGQGSAFTVSLWQKVSNPQAVGDISITGYSSTNRTGRHEASFVAADARILIVDDNEMNLEVEKKLLDGTGITVDTVTSGEAALMMTMGKRYDIILMDHLMQQMDGIECLQRIRKQTGGLNNHAPIIVLTANAGSENRELYRVSGFDGYLLKPVSGQQLEEMIAAHLPESKIIYSSGQGADRTRMNTAKGYNKKTPVIIATNSMCDLPEKTLRDLQIDIIPFRIHVDGREYYDGIEVESDEIIRYMNEGKSFVSEPPTVEEFEYFFAKELKKAHQVIYITLGSCISKEYERAKEASKGYGNVFVFNSGFNSSSVGMLTLIAYNMSVQGLTPAGIISELTRMKKNIHCSFMSSDPGILFRRGFVGRGIYEIMTSIGLKPFILVNNDTIKVDRIKLGNREKSYDRYVDYALPKWGNPDPELLFVTYSGVQAETLERIKKRIEGRFSFDRIIFQKSSAALSLSVGAGSFGLLYLEKTEAPYNIGKLIFTDEDSDAEETDTAEPDGEYVYENSGDGQDKAYESAADRSGVSEYANGRAAYATNKAGFSDDANGRAAYAADRSVSSDRAKGEDAWYFNIEGIDPEVAIENSGSEESFRTVLKIFYDSIEPKAKELSGYYDSGDIENYTIKVHALKSSAKLVGALKLSEDARALEMAGKENDAEFISAHHKELIDELMGFREPLSELFKGQDVQEEPDLLTIEEKSPHPAAGINDFLLECMYEAVSEGVKQKNISALKGTFNELSDYTLPESDSSVFARLKERLDAEDLDGMRTILNEIGRLKD